jgi:hypothetical protein
MKKDTPYTITEWDWLKVRLQLHAVWIRSTMYAVDFDFDREDGRLGCLIYGKHASTMVRERATHKEQLEYYRGWVQMEKDFIRKILKGLPVLRRELQLERDVVFLIMDNYGMGSIPICQIVGRKVVWKLSARDKSSG